MLHTIQMIIALLLLAILIQQLIDLCYAAVRALMAKREIAQRTEVPPGELDAFVTHARKIRSGAVVER